MKMSKAMIERGTKAAGELLNGGRVYSDREIVTAVLGAALGEAEPARPAKPAAGFATVAIQFHATLIAAQPDMDPADAADLAVDHARMLQVALSGRGFGNEPIADEDEGGAA